MVYLLNQISLTWSLVMDRLGKSLAWLELSGFIPCSFWDHSNAQHSLNIAGPNIYIWLCQLWCWQLGPFLPNAKSNSTQCLEIRAETVFSHETWTLQMDASCETKAALQKKPCKAFNRGSHRIPQWTSSRAFTNSWTYRRLRLMHISFMWGHIAERYSKLVSRGKCLLSQSTPIKCRSSIM